MSDRNTHMSNRNNDIDDFFERFDNPSTPLDNPSTPQRRQSTRKSTPTNNITLGGTQRNALMKSEDIKRGITYIFELEQEIAFIEDTTAGLKTKISQLGNKREIPKETVEQEIAKSTFYYIFSIILTIVGIVLGYRWGREEGMFNGEPTLDTLLLVPVGVVGGALIGCLFGLLLDFVLSLIIANYRQGQLYKKYLKKLSDAELKYKDDFEVAKQQFTEELKKKTVLERDLDTLNRTLRSHEIELERLYDEMDILPEYRGFVQMGYMYQLMRIGIGPNLMGIDGLYDRVRQELRADRLENKLDGIRSAIIDSNNRLYMVLNEINNRSNEMISVLEREADQNRRRQQDFNNAINSIGRKMDHIARSTSLSAYSTERSRKLAEYEDFRRRMGR